ncbi:MAG: SIR2 family protein [Firmicutes bacterium]|nr:SIR2 family protein [Bacillota bacterium]
MAKTTTKEILIRDFSQYCSQGNASIFVGSGLSRKAGYVGWKDMLRQRAQDIGLDVDKEENLIDLAQYYVNSQQRLNIHADIREFFAYQKHSPVQEHHIIASLPLASVWTTNYDTLLERAYANANISYDILTNDASYEKLNLRAKVIINKIHGCMNDPTQCVLTRHDYEEFENKNAMVISQLKGELCSKAFLFVGYSLRDTNIQHIIAQMRLKFGKSYRLPRYYILKKIALEDDEFKHLPKAKQKEEFAYHSKRQEHYIDYLLEYGFKVVVVDKYDEITDILEQIRKTVLQKNVWISGAYEDNYNAQYQSLASSFAQEISKNLIGDEFKIITGYGKNLGADIVAGAFSGCNAQGRDFNDNVQLYPFPYKDSKPEDRQSNYTLLRKNMASRSNVLIVIAGQNATHEVANGVLEEVRLSKEQGSLIIPIASTGGAALKVYEDMFGEMKDKQKKAMYEKLNTKKVADIYQVVKDIINQYG